MTQKEYNLKRKKYGIKHDIHNSGSRMYQYAAKHQKDMLRGKEERFSEEEEYMPYGLFFRMRLILCVILFLFFVYAEKNVFTETEKMKVYQAMEQQTHPSNWKNYITDTLSHIKNATDQ